MHDVISIDKAREERRVRASSYAGGPPSSGDWLAGLEYGQRFLAKAKSDPGSELTEFIISTPKDYATDVVLLARNIKTGGGVFEFHISELFSQNWKLYLLLENINANPAPIQPRGVAGHEGAEERPDRDEVDQP